jgi:hypothetical protein
MNNKLEELRKNCGFYCKETYIDGFPNHYCCMVYQHRGVFQKKERKDVTAGGFCKDLETCPINKVLDVFDK